MKNNGPVSHGIGWEDDLKVFLHQSEGRWFPQVKSGYFYLNGQEEYLFAKEGYQDLTVSSGVSSGVVLSGNPDIKSATRNGPLVIIGEEYNWTRVTSNASFYNAYTPTSFGSGGLLYIDVPGELVILTSNSGIDMVSVPTTGHLSERQYYYWDFLNRRCWINRSLSDGDRTETLYVSYLKDRPTLLQEEVILVDYDGKVRTMLDRVSNSTSYVPVIYKIGVGAVSGTADRNVITPSVTLEENDKVAVRYYVDGSFVVYEDTNSSDNVKIDFYRSRQEDVTIRWEQAYHYNHLDLEVFPKTSKSFVQLNPLYSGIESGFLSIGKPMHPAENLYCLKLDVSPLRVSGKQREPARIVVTALDISNNPLPKVRVDCWITDSLGNIYLPSSMDIDTSVGDSTDFLGKRNYMWSSRPQLIGTFTVYASAMSATGAVIIGSHPLIVTESLIFTDAANTSKVNLYLSPNKSADGLRDLYVYLTNQFGVPYFSDLKIAIHCEKGRLYYNTTISSSGENSGTQDIELSFGQSLIDGFKVTTCKYLPVAGDKITAWPTNSREDTSETNWTSTSYSFESVPLEVKEE